MSRCFPYPPPGYAGKCSSNEALIMSIKLQREREQQAKADKKNERKREKKEKRREEKVKRKADKEKKKLPEEKLSHDDDACKTQQLKGGSKLVDEPESGLTDEHGLACHSDGSHTSAKRKSSQLTSNSIEGHVFRIRMSSQKREDDVGSLRKEPVCSSSGRTEFSAQWDGRTGQDKMVPPLSGSTAATKCTSAPVSAKIAVGKNTNDRVTAAAKSTSAPVSLRASAMKHTIDPSIDPVFAGIAEVKNTRAPVSLSTAAMKIINDPAVKSTSAPVSRRTAAMKNKSDPVNAAAKSTSVPVSVRTAAKNTNAPVPVRTAAVKNSSSPVSMRAAASVKDANALVSRAASVKSTNPPPAHARTAAVKSTNPPVPVRTSAVKRKYPPLPSRAAPVVNTNESFNVEPEPKRFKAAGATGFSPAPALDKLVPLLPVKTDKRTSNGGAAAVLPPLDAELPPVLALDKVVPLLPVKSAEVTSNGASAAAVLPTLAAGFPPIPALVKSVEGTSNGALHGSDKVLPPLPGRTGELPPIRAAYSSFDKKMLKREAEYKALFDNWVPPPLTFDLLEPDDQSWLFDTKNDVEPEPKRFKAAPVVDLPCRQRALEVQPRAQYLQEVDVYALPYVLPF